MNKLLTFIAACAGMIVLPTLCFLAQSSGPANHVVFYDYLPFAELALALYAGALGATLGVSAVRWLRKPASPTSSWWRRAQWSACALLAVWLLWPQLAAFPAHAGTAERDAWARRHVRQYPALVRVVGALPEVQRDAGRILAIAPTGDTTHRFAREMNGDDMLFALEVIGERGRGTLRVNCTLDDFMLYDWRPATWDFAGRTTRIETISMRVPR